MESALKAPLSERINLRLIVFFAVIGLVVGYPVYKFAMSEVTGGIRDADDGYKLVDLKAMSTFLFDQQKGTINDVPPQFRALDGQKVILEGEMWQPQAAGDRITSFELCYSILKCCYTSEPQIQHFVQSRVPEGATVRYYTGPVRVKGTLRVNVVKGPEKIESVYQLDVESVELIG